MNPFLSFFMSFFITTYPSNADADETTIARQKATKKEMKKIEGGCGWWMG